jgi:amino acid transporter
MVALTYVLGLIAMVFTAMSYRAMSEAFPGAFPSAPFCLLQR